MTDTFPHRMTTPSDREIRVERTFSASRDRVWRAMTEPELLAQWWGRGNRLDVVRYEFEHGGHWRFVEHTDHGAFGFEGRYREITPPSRLSMTFEFDGMPGHVVVNTIDLEAIDGEHTRLVATMLFLTPEDRDGMMQSGMETGMAESHAALDRVLAAMG